MKLFLIRYGRAIGALSCVTVFALSPAHARDGDGDVPGRKPHYVKCDPAHPEMPCTPDLAPADIKGNPPTRKGDVPGRKPHYVKCDPAHPEMPCTPDLAPADIKGKPTKAQPSTKKGASEGRKPDYVKCDPSRPEMPCTPDMKPVKR